MVAEFHNVFDWTAVGTLALALVTFALAGATFWMVRLTAQALDQNRNEVALSRKEVTEAHRPVIVPATDRTWVDLGADGKHEKRPQLLQGGKLLVTVENVGPGAALNIEATVKLNQAEQSDKPSRPVQVAGIGAGASASLLLDVGDWGDSSVPPSFWLDIEYEDVASTGWLTACLYSPPAGFSVKPIERAKNGTRNRRAWEWGEYYGRAAEEDANVPTRGTDRGRRGVAKLITGFISGH